MHPKELTESEPKCKTSQTQHCFLVAWRHFLYELQGKTRLEQVRAVQTHMNQAEYIQDLVNWGREDYWETPLEFLSKDGDCEDYAIAKFISLRALGIPNKDMRIVILMDNNLNTLHAVLAVDIGEKTYILDNQIQQAVESRIIRHYAPIYAVNETNWFRYAR